MLVHLAYGRDGLDVDLPEESLTVIEPLFVPGLPDEQAAIVQALRQPVGSPPLRELAKPNHRVAIVFSDLTRPVPNRRLLPPLLAELSHVPKENIVLIDALGMHRPNSEAELASMLGEDILARYRVVNHDAHDQSQLVHLGRTSYGNEVWINRQYVEADVRILTGFIEPHFFAGFSGGAKSILPGLAGANTVMRNHSASMVGHAGATWGVTQGNPIFEEMREAAALAKPSFILNVTTNKHKAITGVFAGDLVAAHDAGCAFARRSVVRKVPQAYDVVVATNSGYPLDLNLYQAVKGMSAAAEVVKPGGAIVLAAECAEGIGHGNFEQILRMRSQPAELLEMINAPGFQMFDQWEAQILAQIRLKAEVYLYSHTLTDTQVREAHLQPCADIAATVRRLLAGYGPGASLCVLPQGPLTIPQLAIPQLAIPQVENRDAGQEDPS